MAYLKDLLVTGDSRIVGDLYVNGSIKSNTVGLGLATCTTAAATIAKVATLVSYTLQTGTHVLVKFTYDVPANATLNINNTGAKEIWYKGAKVTGYEISGGDIATLYYDGTRYNLLSTDGGSGKALIPGGKIWVE